MHSLFGKRGALLAGLFALALTALAPSVASAKPEPGPKKGFRLFARSLGALTINRVYCGLASDGQVCVDSANSSTIGGGYWPKGSANQYVFNSGLQIAGIVGADGGPWAGDITGAFFFNARGGGDGEEVLPIYNSQNPDDAQNWPDAALVPNELADANQLFNPLLRGRVTASQGDVWWLSWDGNPSQVASRPHPLGLLIETRGMGWNFPSGNQDIVYFTYTFYNVTSTEEADYANVRPAMRQILLDKAAEFQEENNAAFGITLPTGGYTLENLFAAFGADMDVADAGSNYSSVNLPFALGYTYEHTFGQAEGWSFGDASIFGAPFFAGVGFVGVKYLRSPTGAGAIQLFSNTLNSPTGFQDANNTTQLYRYLSGTVNAVDGDQQCNFGPAATTHICFIASSEGDSRFFQSSTPLTLAPGEFGSIVVAYIFAAPVAVPGFSAPVSDEQPGDPRKLSDFNGLLGNDVNRVDQLTGFVSFTDRGGLNGAPNNQIDQVDFNVVPGSLLGKANTAQAVFDNGFLLPFAPESPQFFLVPGDGQVTVLWQPSSTETNPDPYFQVANAPILDGDPNVLYDPNYRDFDVEGYRIYRGRTDSPSELQLIAQFDYAGTTIKDFAAQVNPTNGCAPELDINIMTITPTPDTTDAPTAVDTAFGCPIQFDPVVAGVARTAFVEHQLVGEVFQTTVAPGGSPARQELASGTAIVTALDTAVTGGKSGNQPLSDTGVPFAYIDRTVRNNFRYFYSVIAFDVNSFQSGPSSLESARVTKSTTPVAGATNVTNASLTATILGGTGDTPLNPDIEFLIDGQTGRFNGPPPPTNALDAVFEPLVPVLLPAVNLTATIDSAFARSGSEFDCGSAENALGICMQVFTTFNRDGVITRFVSVLNHPVWSDFDGASSSSGQAGSLPIDPEPAAIQRFGVPAGFTQFNAAIGVTMQQYIDFSSMEGQAARRGRLGAANISPGGSRWFSGANETVDDPTTGIRVGHLDGVDTIWAPIHHTDTNTAVTLAQTFGNSGAMQCWSYAMAGLGRAADVEILWGASGQVTSVTDISHQVPVISTVDPGASYGFIGDANADGVVSWGDFDRLETANQNGAYASLSCGTPTLPAAQRAKLTPQPTIGPVSIASAPYAAPPVSGQGFGLYINGERYIFVLTGGAAPAPNTKWTLRTYVGRVRASAATAATADPSGYTLTAPPRQPIIPGVRVQFNVAQPTTVAAAVANDLSRVHTVPDPYYVTNDFEQSTDTKIIKFVNLPDRAIIRIYSSSGVLVRILEQNSQTLGGTIDWDVRNRNNQVVASGVYFYHVEAGDARKIGRFTVVNFAQ